MNNIKDLRDYLNSLSSDFDNIRVAVNVNNNSHSINSVKLYSKELIVNINENFAETIFDDISMSSLKCVRWNNGIKLQMVKSAKEAMGLGLKEAKDIIDRNIPFVVATGKSNERYEELKEIFPPDTEFEIE